MPAVAAIAFAAFFAIGVFMSLSASEPIWDAFDPLRFLQFPWRYLGLVSLGAAGLAGAWLALLRDRPIWAQLALAAVLVGIFVGTGQHFFEPFHRCEPPAGPPLDCPGNDAEYFAPERFHLHQQGSINDYLPAAVDVVPEQPPESPAQVIDGSGEVVGRAWESDRLEFAVEAETAVRVEAAVFDFDGWRVEADGERIDHDASTSNGLIAFELPAGEHEVELRLEDTTPRRIGNWLSLASWTALVLGPPAFWLGRRWREAGQR